MPVLVAQRQAAAMPVLVAQRQAVAMSVQLAQRPAAAMSVLLAPRPARRHSAQWRSAETARAAADASSLPALRGPSRRLRSGTASQPRGKCGGTWDRLGCAARIIRALRHGVQRVNRV